MICVDMEGTGNNIARIREKKGITTKQMQRECGVSAAAVCKWQKGICIPTVDNLVILAGLFGVEIGQIIATKIV